MIRSNDPENCGLDTNIGHFQFYFYMYPPQPTSIGARDAHNCIIHISDPENYGLGSIIGRYYYSCMSTPS